MERATMELAEDLKSQFQDGTSCTGTSTPCCLANCRSRFPRRTEDGGRGPESTGAAYRQHGDGGVERESR